MCLPCFCSNRALYVDGIIILGTLKAKKPFLLINHFNKVESPKYIIRSHDETITAHLKQWLNIVILNHLCLESQWVQIWTSWSNSLVRSFHFNASYSNSILESNIRKSKHYRIDSYVPTLSDIQVHDLLINIIVSSNNNFIFLHEPMKYPHSLSELQGYFLTIVHWC